MNSRVLSLSMPNRRIARIVVTCASLLLVGGLASAQTCSPPGLVAWWPGEGSAVDVTGWHDGTLVGGVTFAPGIVGSALKFDGSDSVQVPDSPELDPTAAITAEAWIKPAPGQGGYPPIIKKNGTNDRSGYALEMAGDTGMCFYVSMHDPGWRGTCAGITPGQWSHVAGAYDGRTIMLYINGVLASSTPMAGTIEPPDGNLGIGTDPTLGRHFTGLIDEPAIFNRALAPSEIAAIYTSGANGHCGSQTTGVVIRSYSVTYNTIGTLSASLFKDATPVVGQALEFLVQGASAGSATTDLAGLATVVLPPSRLNAGLYPGGLEVRFAGDVDLAPQTARADLLVYQYLPTITWPQPAPVVEGTSLSAAQLNATVDAPGSLVYEPPAGTVLDYGHNESLLVRFVPDDPQNYLSAAAEQLIDVTWRNVVGDRSAPVAMGRIIGGHASGGREVNPAIDSLRDLVYLPNAADGTVVVADGLTSETARTIPLNSNGVVGVAGAMALDQVHNRLYVADVVLPLLWVVDPIGPTPVVQTMALPGASSWLDFNPSTGLLYAVIDGAVAVIDPGNPSNLVSIPVCRSDQDSVTINPATNLIYVATGCGPTEIIDGDPQRSATFNTIVGELPTSTFGLMTAVAVSRRTSRVYVLAYGSEDHNWVHVFDGDPRSSTFHQELDVISLARSGAAAAHDWAMWPTGIAIDPSRQLLYVRASDWQGNDMCDSSLTAVDVIGDVVASVTMLPWADQNCSFGRVGVNPNTGRIYVTSANNVTTVLQEIRTLTLTTDTSAGPVTVPSSQVSVTFAAVTAAGQTTVEQVDPGTLSPALPGGFQIDGGPAFEISTTASVTTPIRLCFDASSVTDPATFATLAVMHGENGVFVDRTVSRDFATGTICASVSSLSPFVIARRIGPAYHLQPLYDPAKAVAAGSTIPVRVRLLDASGRNVSSATLPLRAASIALTAGGSAGPVNDAGRANPDGVFRFDPTLEGYVFNLSTRGLLSGSYRLSIEGPDKPLRYAVAIQIR